MFLTVPEYPWPCDSPTPVAQCGRHLAPSDTVIDSPPYFEDLLSTGGRNICTGVVFTCMSDAFQEDRLQAQNHGYTTALQRSRFVPLFGVYSVSTRSSAECWPVQVPWIRARTLYRSYGALPRRFAYFRLLLSYPA